MVDSTPLTKNSVPIIAAITDGIIAKPYMNHESEPMIPNKIPEMLYMTFRVIPLRLLAKTVIKIARIPKTPKKICGAGSFNKRIVETIHKVSINAPITVKNAPLAASPDFSNLFKVFPLNINNEVKNRVAQ